MPLSRAMTKYKLLLPLILFLVHCGSSDEGNPSSNEPPPDYFAPTFSVNGFDPQCEYMPIIEIYPPPYEGQELSCRTSERLFYLYLPKDYSEIEAAFPAMFSLHGYTSTAETNINYTDFQKLADAENFIVIYPQGLVHETKGGTHWNIDEIGPGNSVNSIAFLESVLDWAGENFNVDLKRFYSAGMSNGGFMSYHLACNISSKIAAVASVTGAMSSFTYDNCSAQPTSVLQIHGMEDTVVPYAGTITSQGVGYRGIEDVMDFWARNNSCDLEPTIFPIPDISGDGQGGSHKIFSNCANGVSVELYLLDGMGHEWPGKYERYGGSDEFDITSAEVIWSFFNQFNIDGRM